MKGWASMGEIERMTRQQILDANDILAAMDEAEEDARTEQEKSKRDR